MQNTNINSPKRSVRLNNKRLARLDIKKDANTDTPSVHADFNAPKINHENILSFLEKKKLLNTILIK